MTFLWHHALWLLLALPALAGAYLAWLRRRMKSAVSYPSFALVREAMTPAARLRPHLPPILFFAGFAALLVSVPQGGSIAAVTEALVKAKASVRATALVGSHARRYTVAADRA